MVNSQNKLCDTCEHENVCKDREEVLGAYKELTERLVSLTDLLDNTCACKNHLPVTPIPRRKW